MTARRLVAMANQIAMNAPDRDRAAEEVAAHLRTFWTPAMIATLEAHTSGGAGDVSDEVTDALAILRRRATQES